MLNLANIIFLQPCCDVKMLVVFYFLQYFEMMPVNAKKKKFIFSELLSEKAIIFSELLSEKVIFV